MADQADPTDFQQMAAEAAQQAYNPRARRCWPFMHEWTMWELTKHPYYFTMVADHRRCVRCGRNQYRKHT